MYNKDLIEDLKKTLVGKIGRLTEGYNEHTRKAYIDIELSVDEPITVCDMPHLLTISANYDVNIEIYPIEGNVLGVYVSWVI